MPGQYGARYATCTKINAKPFIASSMIEGWAGGRKSITVPHLSVEPSFAYASA